MYSTSADPTPVPCRLTGASRVVGADQLRTATGKGELRRSVASINPGHIEAPGIQILFLDVDSPAHGTLPLRSAPTGRAQSANASSANPAPLQPATGTIDPPRPVKRPQF